MSNPDNALGTNGAYGGRTSVNAFNDVMASFKSRGILSGWACAPSSGLKVTLGGDGTTRDVAIAEDNSGNKTSVNNISQAPVEVTMPAAPANNSRIDSIVAYIESSPSSSGETDNYTAVNLLTVSGSASATPTAPSDGDIRTAITADGASGPTAYYVVLANVTIASGTTDIDASMISAGTSAQLTAKNIDFTTLPHYEVNSTTNMNIGSGATSFVTVLSLQIADPGYYYVYGYCGVYKSSTSEVCDVRTRIQGGNWMPYSIFHMYGSGQYEGGAVGGIIEISSANTTINLQVNQTNGNITMRTEYLRNMCAFRVG